MAPPVQHLLQLLIETVTMRQNAMWSSCRAYRELKSGRVSLAQSIYEYLQLCAEYLKRGWGLRLPASLSASLLNSEFTLPSIG